MMTSVEQLIGDLLMQNNCVIVPSFGGFVAQQVSAKIDFDSGKIFPPRKSLLFNKQLINNDGLLINELAKKNNIDFDLASKEVNNKINGWNTTLSNGGRIELDRIGFLYNDAENNLCFEQDRFFNLLLESFGLGHVHFLTEEDIQITEQNIRIEEKATVIVPITAEPIVVEKSPEIEVVEHPVLIENRTNIWRYVAAACILPIAFYSIWIPMKTDVLESGMLSMNDFNPFHKKEAVQYEKSAVNVDFTTPKPSETSFNEVVENLPTDIEVYSYKYDDAFFIPVNLNEENSSDLEPIESESFSANTMHYIVGCFGDESNAKNLVSKLNAAGLVAQVVDVKNGLHRVSAGSAISIESLDQIKTISIDLGFKGWVLK